MAVSKNTTKESIVLFTTLCILNRLSLLIFSIYDANLKQIYSSDENKEKIIQFASNIFTIGYAIAYLVQGINMEAYGFQKTFFAQLSLLAIFLIQIPLYKNIFMINLLHLTLGFLVNFHTLFIALILKNFEGLTQVRNVCYFPLNWVVGFLLFPISTLNLSLPLNYISNYFPLEYFLLTLPNFPDLSSLPNRFAYLLILGILFLIYIVFKYMDLKEVIENKDLGPINYGAIEVQSNDKTFISHVQLISKSISKMDASTQLILSYLTFSTLSVASLVLMHINFVLPINLGGLGQVISSGTVAIVVLIYLIVYFKSPDIIQKYNAKIIYFNSVKYQTILLSSIVYVLFFFRFVFDYDILVARIYLILFVLALTNYFLGSLAYYPMISQLENNKIGLGSVVGLCLSIDYVVLSLFLLSPWMLSLYVFMLKINLKWFAMFNPTWLLLLGFSFLHFKLLFKQNYQFKENLQGQV